MLFHATDCACRECIIERSVHQAEHAGQRHTFDVSDLDDQDQAPLAGNVVIVTLMRCDGTHTAGYCLDPHCKFRSDPSLVAVAAQPARRSRAKRRR